MSDKEKHTFGFSPEQYVKAEAGAGGEDKKKNKGRSKTDEVALVQPEQDETDNDILAQ